MIAVRLGSNWEFRFLQEMRALYQRAGGVVPTSDLLVIRRILWVSINPVETEHCKPGASAGIFEDLGVDWVLAGLRV
jgi:hypothetical protein